MGFDNHYGKYASPLTALAERWVLDGERGELEVAGEDMRPDGSGAILIGRSELTYRDATWLESEYGANREDLGALCSELESAQAIIYAWDSQGFQYSEALTSMAEVAEARARLEAEIAAADEAEAAE